MELIDTHCHLDALDEQRLPEIFANAQKCGVTKIISVGASEGAQSAKAAVGFAEKYENVWASIGIHPHDAGDYEDLKLVESLASHPKVVAIGETGLDFYRDWAPRDRQRTLFRNSIALARSFNKPLIVHCRSAEEETLQILQEEKTSEVGGVFHCYNGNAGLAKKLRTINFRVSFTGSITFKKAFELKEAAKEIPLDQIMVETDAPYMAPEPFRGKPSEPMHVYQVALQLASLKNITLDEVSRMTSKNAEELFGISSRRMVRE